MRANTKEAGHTAQAAEQARQALIGRREAMLRALPPGEERELRDIDAALKRIDGGRWGLCDVCDHAIGHQLLRAMPERAICLACERK